MPAGRTIMTTEPKFIPNEAVEIKIGNNISLKTRLVDCVGYLVNNAIGYDGFALYRKELKKNINMY